MLAMDVSVDLGTFRLEAKLDVKTGVTLLVGPNGAGKSTFLKTLLGIIKPNKGTITLNERVLFSSQDGINTPTEDRQLGYVPQNNGLFPHLTASQNIEFGILDQPKSIRERKVEELLHKLQILPLANRKARLLSGGESQRVALARALAVEPAVVLLDEPMAALDASARRIVRQFLSEHLQSLSIPTLVVSHDARDVQVLADHVAVLQDGKIVQRGTPIEVHKTPANNFIKEFLGSQTP